MISEVERLKDVNINKKMTNFFTDERTAVVLQLVRGKKGASPFLHSIERCCNMDLSNNLYLFMQLLLIALGIYLLFSHPQRGKVMYSVIYLCSRYVIA